MTTFSRIVEQTPMSVEVRATSYPDVRRFRRVLLKLSGEGLMGSRSFGLDLETVERLAAEIKVVHENGIELGLVVGGGNIFRGITGAVTGTERTNADHMGMLATVINALAMSTALERIGCPVRVMSAIPMPTVCEPFIHHRALYHLGKGRVVIFAAGTGNPFFTTDTAATLRAIEMACDVLLKATQVDGVYSADPRTDNTAQRYDNLTYTEVLVRNLQVMDAAAIALARENCLPVFIFSLHNTETLADVLAGHGLFTIISDEGVGLTMTYQELKKDLRHRMDVAIEILRKELAGLRTGRASLNLLDPVMVDAYGTAIPLVQLATVSVSEPRLLTVQVWNKNMVKAVEKAIRDANLGLNPAAEGQNVRVPIPPLSEERRAELAKVAHRYAEQARVSVRNVRRDGMDSLKKMEKDGTISQDLQRQHNQDVQTMTDEHIQRVDETLAAKEKEIMQV